MINIRENYSYKDKEKTSWDLAAFDNPVTIDNMTADDKYALLSSDNQGYDKTIIYKGTVNNQSYILNTDNGNKALGGIKKHIYKLAPHLKEIENIHNKIAYARSKANNDAINNAEYDKDSDQELWERVKNDYSNYYEKHYNEGFSEAMKIVKAVREGSVDNVDWYNILD